MLYYMSKLFWDFGAPSRMLELLTIAASFRAMVGSRRAALLVVASVVTLLAVGIAPIGGWLFMPLEARFPPWESTSSPPLYGIIALGGDTGHRITELARVSRLFPQAELVYSGRGDQLAAELELRHAGLDPARVVIESLSRNTSENAIDTAQIVRPTSAEQWLLITSAAHMPRAVGCFRQAGFRVIADPVDFHTDRTSFIYARTADQRIAQLNDAAKEWLGLVAYRIVGDTNALFPGP